MPNHSKILFHYNSNFLQFVLQNLEVAPENNLFCIGFICLCNSQNLFGASLLVAIHEISLDFNIW